MDRGWKGNQQALVLVLGRLVCAAEGGTSSPWGGRTGYESTGGYDQQDGIRPILRRAQGAEMGQAEAEAEADQRAQDLACWRAQQAEFS